MQGQARHHATSIEVAVPKAPYQVVIGAGLLHDLSNLLPALPPHAQHIVIVSSKTVYELYGETVETGLISSRLARHIVEIPDGEEAKSLETLEYCWHAFAEYDICRDDIVIALGGGVVGDVAGFAAATWDRGVSWIQIPTTLVAQADSSIGGKTAINTPEGKSLVGAFHQPLIVIADTSTLQTLPIRERRAGLAEIVKYGFIADPVILDAVEERPEDAVSGEPQLINELVRRGAAVKARIVGSDEREAGVRSLLNYGHTVGHAIETLTEYSTYRHGEAISLGMVFAARLGERLGVSQKGLADRTVAILNRLGLPTGGIQLDIPATWEVLRRDKKVRLGVRFVLCEHPGQAVLVDQPDVEVINDVLKSLAHT